jgi:hypothetical protein
VIQLASVEEHAFSGGSSFPLFLLNVRKRLIVRLSNSPFDLGGTFQRKETEMQVIRQS